MNKNDLNIRKLDFITCSYDGFKWLEVAKEITERDKEMISER